MERIRPIITAAVAAAGLLASLGCTATQQSSWKAAVHSTVAPSAAAGPPPAAEIACMWQNRLAMLPDPSRNGAAAPGVVGQMFLFTTDLKPAEITGDLMVTVHDSTPRKAGASPMTSEVWHFTAETLRKMTVSDERYGRTLLLFLPWPETWRDVNRLYIETRYVQGTEKLYTQPATVTLDTQAPGGVSQAPGGVASRIPDPGVLLTQAKSQRGSGPIPAGGTAWAGPVPSGPQQPWAPPLVPVAFTPQAPPLPPQRGQPQAILPPPQVEQMCPLPPPQVQLELQRP